MMETTMEFPQRGTQGQTEEGIVKRILLDDDQVITL